MVAKVSPGTLYVVATPIGNLDDVTLRALTILRQVDLVAAEDTRQTSKLLQRHGVEARLFSLHEHNEAMATERVIDQLTRGRSVALVSDAGTPLVSDPGYPLVRHCRERGLSVVAIPGASAVIAALSVAGLPPNRFRFEGFLPRKSALRREALRSIENDRATLVFFESSHRILEAIDDMVAVLGGTRSAVVARELTKLHETVLSGTLVGLKDRLVKEPDQRRGEFVLLVEGQRKEVARESTIDVAHCLTVLLAELPLKQAVALTVKLTGQKRNKVYKQAVALCAQPFDEE